MITVLAGGVGAARLLAGLVQVVSPATITAIVNVGDDVEMHGLHISPDLDTVTYTLAGAINPDTGWGLVDETWQAMETLRRYGGPAWFGLGDRDLGTHLYRTHRLGQGATLDTVSTEIARGWGLELRLLPVTNDPLRTKVTILDDEAAADDGADESPTGFEAADAATIEIGFQEYFVQRRHDVVVRSVRFEGAEGAEPAPGVLPAIANADSVIIAPSNPIVSIGPVLAVVGVREALAARRNHVVAVSPIIAGAALKGPADRMLAELGHESSVVGVARLYRDVAGTLVIDEADADLADCVEAEGMRCVVAPTIMSDPAASAALGRVVVAA
jgi:LPPG:FO 2-phospho-L-lactate transferase